MMDHTVRLGYNTSALTRFSGSYNTKINLVPLNQPMPPEKEKVDILVVPLPEKRSTGKNTGRYRLPEYLKPLDNILRGALQKVLTDENFNGNGTHIVQVRADDAVVAKKKVIITGIGDPRELTAAGAEKAIAAALKAGGKSNTSAAIVLPKSTKRFSDNAFLRAATLGIHQATYRSNEARESGNFDLKKVTLVPPNLIDETHIQDAEALAHGISWAKDLANSPHSHCKVETLMGAAKDLAEHYHNIDMEIKGGAYDKRGVEWIKTNMPAFWAVAQASEQTEPPAFIKLHYKKGNSTKKTVIIGKGVTYDTGGINLKPSQGGSLEKMHMDMTGGAYVLGLMKTLGELQPDNLDVTVYLAATPNLIGEKSYTPGSIVKTAVGQRVLIGNTDAEGRLTLIDTVHEAMKDNPDELITIATLTGASANANGPYIANIANLDKRSQKLGAELKAIANKLGDHLTNNELRQDDFAAINIAGKNDAADLVNAVPGARGQYTAAAFVMSGVPKEKPAPAFVHLDIAGLMMPSEHGGGAIGSGMPTLLEHLVKNKHRKLG